MRRLENHGSYSSIAAVIGDSGGHVWSKYLGLKVKKVP